MRIRVCSCTVAAAAETFKIEDPHVLILDMRSPAFENTNLIGGFSHSGKKARTILLLSGAEPLAYIRFLSRSGIGGLLSPHSSLAELATGIRAVRDGKHFLAGDLTDRLIADTAMGKPNPSRLFFLSLRELQIARLLISGMTAKQVADRIGLSAKTIDTHRHNIFKKLKIKKIAGLINLFYEYKLN